MWNIIKSLFRYSSKNIVSLTMLSVLMILASTIFGSLNFLSTNLNNSYDYLVENGNLNNVVINELYSSTFISQDGTEVKGEKAKLLNKQAFYNDLSQLIGRENFRDFKALDFSNVSSSSNGFIYKIVDNPSQEIIDKTVIYEGQNVLNQTFDFDQIMNDANLSVNGVYNPTGASTNKKDKTLLGAQARRLVLFLAIKAKWTNPDDVKSFITSAESILKITDLNDVHYDPANPSNKNRGAPGKQAYTKISMWLDPSNKEYTPLISKGYRLAFDFGGPSAAVPLVGNIDNLSSYTAVASPSTLEKQQKQICDQSFVNNLASMNSMPRRSNESIDEFNKYDYDYSNIAASYINQQDILDMIRTANTNNMIEVDNLRYFIVGSGISPNFMYPVYSFERQTPNLNSEALIYTNNAGYYLAFDSARSSPVESYIVAKVNQDNLQNIINQINDIASKYMIWPKPLKAAYAIDDTTNSLAPVSLRVMFIPELVKVQTIISTVLSIFLLALVLMIFIFTIKKFINDLRVPLGVLRANGVRKHVIVLAMPILCLFPALIGGIIGYLVSQFTQTSFLSLYSFYWTIPTPTIAFSAGMFFGLLLVPFAVMAIISMVYTYLVLKGNVANLMKESSYFKATTLSKFITRTFKNSNVLTKFRASIAFSSLPKLTMITVMFSLLLVSIDVGLGLNGKFDYAKEMTFKNKNYNFAVDLIQPKLWGGQYFRQQTTYPGRVVLNDKNEILNFNIGMADGNYQNLRGQKGDSMLYMDGTNNFSYDNFKPSNPYNTSGQMLLNHLPSIDDGGWQKNDISYLRYKLEDPATVNSTVGVPGIASTNPWDIARNLAPMNQITLSNNMYKKLWKTIMLDNNVYFNDVSLQNNGLKPNSKDYKNMLNKPLNMIVYNAKFVKLSYIDKNNQFNIDNGYNTLPTPANNDKNNPNLNKALVKDDTIEFYDPNDPNVIIQQWKVDYNAINNTFTISPQIVIIMQTLMNLNNKEYTQEFINTHPNINFDIIKEYKDTFFNVVYSYIPMSNDDETYTKVNCRATGFDNPIPLIGIKPDSNYIKLENSDNEIVNYKLRLENVDEDKYVQNAINENGKPGYNDCTCDDIQSLHDLYLKNGSTNYFDSLINDQQNFKMIINETAAFKYNLSIGDTIEVNPQDEATYINGMVLKNSAQQAQLQEINSKTYKFKIVDIIETYQNPEFYINQRVANFINGMATPSSINQSFYNEYKGNTVVDDNGWFNYSETRSVKAIDPFNGMFTKNKSPDIINGLSLYSQSGLAPGTDKFMESGYFTTLINNVMSSTTKDLSNPKNQSAYISKMTLASSLGYDVNLNNPNPTQQFDDDWKTVFHENPFEIVNQLITYYGESPLLSSSVYIEPVQTFSELFVNVSDFVNSIFIMILIIILLLTVLSIYYLAIDFVKQSIGMISMLRAYGFKNDENVFSFLSIFFPSLIIAFAISFVSIPIFIALKTFVLNFANICIPISLEWWYVIVGLIVGFAMLGITLLIALIILKRMNAAKSITRI